MYICTCSVVDLAPLSVSYPSKNLIAGAITIIKTLVVGAVKKSDHSTLSLHI